ncbi:AAA family ATPase [Sphingomonas echinoides]|uniref:AAA family ATPase n=1 Tax=Sphingomonas echinoides TaxID=59803 RepID=UPI0024135038|nr:AAA family ATPase [Sphingomonas echinoides]
MDREIEDPWAHLDVAPAHEWNSNWDAAGDISPTAPPPAPETFELADLEQWATTTPVAKAFVMAPFIPRDDVVIITGDGGTNKSTLALQLSACAAAGRQFLGMSVTPGPALYITAEDDNRENHWRLAKIAQTIGTTLSDLAGRLHIVSLRGRMNNELATFEQDGRLRSTAAYALLRATIQKTGAKLVTLDNVAHLFAGNENDRGQVTAFINLLYQLCGDLGVTILLVAHRNKSGDSYSGSTAWLNAVRSQVLLERSEEGDADARRMSLGKANYARAGEDLAFRWHDFALVRDADLPDDQREQLAVASKAARENGIFLDCLRERAKQGDGRAVGPSVGPSYAPKQFEGMAQAKGLKSAQFKSAMERLFAIGAIESHTYRNTGKGRDVTVIREAPELPRTTTPNVPRALVPSHPEPQARTTPRTYSISKDITGAANGAAAPSDDDVIWESEE